MLRFLATFIFGVALGCSSLHAKEGLSKESQALMSLYDELHEFKDDPEFHEIGFAVCCRFNRWLVDVQQLTDRTGIEIMSEVGFLPGDLLQLGTEYMRSKGQPTSYSNWMEATIAEAR